ncbi:MAG: peroxiredoxin family protein [Bacteroidota bacterium]
MEAIHRLQGELEAISINMNLPQEIDEVITNSIIDSQRGPVQGIPLMNTAPDFTLPDMIGGAVNLYDELKKGPVILSFFRGEWCPYCSMQLQFLQQYFKEFKKHKANVISVHPQKIEVSEMVTSKYMIEFPVLSDPDTEIMELYKVKFNLSDDMIKAHKEGLGLDLAKLNVNGRWNLPVPATFIIDTDRVIKGRHFSHNYRTLMDPVDILTVLKNLPEVTPEKMVNVQGHGQ